MAVVNQQLWAKRGNLWFPDGAEVPFWGFATTAEGEPQFPGPTIRAKVGDEINITLYNNLNDFVSLIFPGQEFIPMPVKENGVFVSYNTHASPGDSVNYSFTATRPGVFLYESGTRPEQQVTMGLYGVLVIHPTGIDDPFDPDYKTAYGGNTGTDFDVEKVLVLGEVDTAFNTAIAVGNASNLLDFEPDHWVINGRSYPHTLLPDNLDWPISQPVSAKVKAASGQRILLRCVNAGTKNHTFRLEGITARVVAVDSWPLKPGRRFIDATYLKNTVSIASGESYDLIFTAGAVGQHYLHDRDLNHLCNVNRFPGGMATRLDVVTAKKPKTPRGLTCSLTSQNEVHLTWRDRSSNEAGFVVERKTRPGDFEEIAVLAEPGQTEYTDSSIELNNTYVYRVRAYNAAGSSGYSNRCTVSTEEVPESPSHLTSTLVSQNEVRLTWRNVSSNEEGFVVERKAGQGDFEEIAVLDEPGLTEYTDSSIEPNTTYVYRVRAYNAAGFSGYSNQCSVTIPSTLEAPTCLRSYGVLADAIILVWNSCSDNVDCFHIERKTGRCGRYEEIGAVDNNRECKCYIDDTVHGNTTYFYRVRAYSRRLEYSDYSNVLKVTTHSCWQ